MDFLDPAKKKSDKIKLAVGHVLMVVLVLIGTYILVYQAYGFDINRKTGEVFQNGLVFIDSAPDGAEIKINGKVHGDQTNTRVALPEGYYELEINKEGYRTWRKNFELEGGAIERFVYPTLFLNDLSSNELQTLDAPTFMTQSPDRRWVLISEKNKLGTFTQYDLNTLENERPVSSSFSLPSDLFTVASGNHNLKLIEWSTDNNHLLVEHTYKGGHEYIVINRDKPEESFNVNELLGSKNPTSVALRDKKIDHLYLYTAKDKSLSLFNVETEAAEIVAKDIVAYKAHGESVIAMAAVNANDPKKTSIIVREDDRDYLVREMVTNEGIELDIAQYDGDWYVAAHDPGKQKTYIYRNPIDFVKKQPALKPAPIMVLRSVGTLSDLSFSQNTQFIAARSGQRFAVYDNEYGRVHNFEIKQPFDKGSEVVWMDGHRFLAHSKGKIIISEFDGQNQQTLISAMSDLPVAFNRDYTELYALQKESKNKKPIFSQTFLRLEEDR